MDPAADLVDFTVYGRNHPDRGRAGFGLGFAPFVRRAIGVPNLDDWMMSPAEQMAMVYFMEHIKPSVAIEIGTRSGGSLQVIARYAEKVYSLDIDPNVPKALAGKHRNVEYIVGDSKIELPRLLARLAQDKEKLDFVLVDGDYSAGGVQADIDNILGYNPVAPLYVVMHDSFNPECRKGLLAAKWSDSPYVQYVELDFVSGVVVPSPAFKGELWGGLALALVTPQKRCGPLEVTGLADATVRRAKRLLSIANLKSHAKNLLARLRRTR
jgi:hypothetical protein